MYLVLIFIYAICTYYVLTVPTMFPHSVYYLVNYMDEIFVIIILVLSVIISWISLSQLPF